MRPIVLHNFSEADVDRALQEVHSLKLSRYNNPFERKSFLENKLQTGPSLRWMFQELCSHTTCLWVQRLLDIPISYADFQHYGGLFIYDQGDYLEPHVDAGIHPKTGQHKVATACLYLTPATLSLWHGDDCTYEKPEVWLEEPYFYEPNDCVLFANDDSAWHSVPLVTSSAPRVVLTISYMAPEGFNRLHYKNTRTRAYFARRHGINDGLDELREQRASEEHHGEVYRYGANLPDHE